MRIIKMDKNKANLCMSEWNRSTCIKSENILRIIYDGADASGCKKMWQICYSDLGSSFGIKRGWYEEYCDSEFVNNMVIEMENGVKFILTNCDNEIVFIRDMDKVRVYAKNINV